MTLPGRAGAIAKTLLFTVLVPGTVTIYVPRRILLSRSGNDALPIGPLRYLGAALLAAGAAVYLWCAWDFATAGRGTPAPIDPPRSLVERGLYRHVRNPMYLGILLLLVGEAMLFRSRALLAYAGLVFLFFFLFVVAYEEPALRRKFGQTYERYCDRVPRWIPQFRVDRKRRSEGQ
jgi:protein-S-isoprenylcysteine O-methyltransferase Ste14